MEINNYYSEHLETIWEVHKGELKKFIKSRVQDELIANELVQEVLIKVFKFCRQNKAVRNVKSWLFQIAHNSIMDYYRKKPKFATQFELPEVVLEDENHSFKEALDYINPLLEFLPTKYSVPLRLFDLEGVKQKDIAIKLGLSLPATKSRIQRGRQLLKAEFLICCDLETDAVGNIITFNIKESCTPLKERKNK